VQGLYHNEELPISDIEKLVTQFNVISDPNSVAIGNQKQVSQPASDRLATAVAELMSSSGNVGNLKKTQKAAKEYAALPSPFCGRIRPGPRHWQPRTCPLYLHRSI
jgi:hypothetical protein